MDGYILTRSGDLVIFIISKNKKLRTYYFELFVKKFKCQLIVLDKHPSLKVIWKTVFFQIKRSLQAFKIFEDYSEYLLKIIKYSTTLRFDYKTVFNFFFFQNVNFSTKKSKHNIYLNTFVSTMKLIYILKMSNCSCYRKWFIKDLM